MKVNTNELYDIEYCRNINAKQWRFKLIPPTIKVLYDHFKPESVIDVGCANGLHLKAFKDLGVKRLFGIEGTHHWGSYIEKYFGEDYIIADIREQLSSFRTNFDLVICFELLEHFEEEFARQAVENLVSLGKTLCISACPIKGGFHHFNPQPRRYWIDIFKEFGVRYCREEVEHLQNIFKEMNCSGWFKSSLKVFRHEDGN